MNRSEVVYYDPRDGRRIYWPADGRPEMLAAKLAECWAAGHVNARLSEVGGRA